MKCWGYNFAGELGDNTLIDRATPVSVSGLTANASSLGLGGSYSCAVRTDHTIRCWGKNDNGELGDGTTTNRSTPVAVLGITNATAVAGGNKHTCALLQDGTIKCWGRGVEGQLGNNTTTDSLTPVAVTGISTATAIETGDAHSCALLSDGSVRCWGVNTEGELGDGTFGASLVPVTVVGLNDITKITSGEGHNCAIDSSKAIHCWGFNADGELGNGGTTNSNIPVTVVGISNATAISAGIRSSCALLSTGAVQCWGNNVDGRLGNGTTTNSLIPVSVTGISTAESLAGGLEHACVGLTSGAVKCWGNNGADALGDGRPTRSSTPASVSLLSGELASAVAVGQNHSCMLLADGKVKCWGYNNGGRLGDSTTVNSATPKSAATTVAQTVSAGLGHTCSVLTDLTVGCWGANGEGQLGNGTLTSSSSLVAVTGVTGASKVSAASNHTCVLLNSQNVRCWGNNDVGQLGDTTTTDSSTSVATSVAAEAVDISAGYDHACAALNNGGARRVECWGGNNDGQLGNNTTTSAPTPVTVIGLVNPIAVAAGRNHTCALDLSGTVYCWGQNDSGELGDGTLTQRLTAVQVSGISDATAIASGSYHSCARLSQGTVKCWGKNEFGQLGNGATTDSAVPVFVSNITAATSIAAGQDGTCSRIANQTLKCWGFEGTYGELGRGNIPFRSTAVDVALLAVSDNSLHASIEGAPVIFSLAVPGDATGTVAFSDLGVPIADCELVAITPDSTLFSSQSVGCTTTLLQVGSRSISVTSPANYSTASIASDAFTVTAALQQVVPSPASPPATPVTPASPPTSPPVISPLTPEPAPAPNGSEPPPVANGLVDQPTVDGVTAEVLFTKSSVITSNASDDVVVVHPGGTTVVIPKGTVVTDVNDKPLASVEVTVSRNADKITIASPPLDAGSVAPQFSSPVMKFGPPGTKFTHDLSILLPVPNPLIPESTCWSCPDGTSVVTSKACEPLRTEKHSDGVLQCFVRHFSLVFALTAPPSEQASEGGAGAQPVQASVSAKSGCALSPIGKATATPSLTVLAAALVWARRRRRSEPSRDVMRFCERPSGLPFGLGSPNSSSVGAALCERALDTAACACVRGCEIRLLAIFARLHEVVQYFVFRSNNCVACRMLVDRSRRICRVGDRYVSH